MPTSLPAWLRTSSDEAPTHGPDHIMEVEELKSESLQLNVEGDIDEVIGHPASSSSSSLPSCLCKRHECQQTTGPSACLEKNKSESQVGSIIDLTMHEFLLTSTRRAE
jgi:hypothetical protein